MYLDLSLFSKYFKKRNEKKVFQEKIISSIKEVTTISLEEKNITYKNNTLFITTHPVLKSTILLRKQEILDCLKKQSVFIENII